MVVIKSQERLIKLGKLCDQNYVAEKAAANKQKQYFIRDECAMTCFEICIFFSIKSEIE